MKIVFSPQAHADMVEIFTYISSDNPAAARALLARIRDKIGNLAKAPHIGRPGRVPGTRELVIPGTPFLVPYQVGIAENTLQILRVYHGAREWPEAFL